MPEYVEKEPILRWLEMMQNKHPRKADAFGAAKIHIEHVPAADLAPTAHGEWVEYDDDYGNLCCSVCENDSPDDRRWGYCPHCGARMDGADKP